MMRKAGALIRRVICAFIFCLIAAFGRAVSGVRVKGEKPRIEGGALLLCNHSCLFDFAHLACAVFPKRVRFVARSMEFSKNAVWTWILNTIGVISKKQGASDVACVREIVRACRAGEIVAMYPAGMTSFDGRPAWGAQSGTGTLAKLLGVDVYACVSEGAFLSKPRYTGGMFRGRVDVSVKKLFGCEEIRALDAGMVQAEIDKALDFNEWDWQKKERVRFFGGNRVKGLTRALYFCPSCGAEETLMEKRNALVCRECGMIARRDRFGFFSAESGICPERMDEWADLQLRALSEDTADENFRLCANVAMEVAEEGKGKFLPADEGTLTLRRDELLFDGKRQKLRWTYRDFQYFVLNDIDFIQIYTSENAYRFVFRNGENVSRWFYAHRLMALEKQLPESNEKDAG